MTHKFPVSRVLSILLSGFLTSTFTADLHAEVKEYVIPAKEEQSHTATQIHTANQSDNQDASSFSFGLGSGLFYSGIGVNLGLRTQDSFKYFSLGCAYLGVYHSESSCGPGIGYVRAVDLKRKHGLGIYFGLIDSEIEWEPVYTTFGVIRKQVDREEVYGLGISYIYYANGINKPGWNIGFSTTLGNYHHGGMTSESRFQWGYQF